jgi:DNA-binding PadR family transcriptional regulator
MSEQPKKRYIDKERESLLASANRIALLFVIRDFESQGGIHGYGISDVLNSQTFGELDGSNAVYYAILRQMRLDNLIEQFEKDDDARKYYRLTAEGHEVCDKLWQYWQHYFNILNVLNEQKKN